MLNFRNKNRFFNSWFKSWKSWLDYEGIEYFVFYRMKDTRYMFLRTTVYHLRKRDGASAKECKERAIVLTRNYADMLTHKHANKCTLSR